jgi:NitT/TauT family transport system ATP-binding protein
MSSNALLAGDLGSLHMETAFEFRNACKSYVKSNVATPVLKNVSLRASPGEFIALVGPSGSGKSTLLNLLAGLLKVTSGDVIFQGQPVQDVNTHVGYVTQRDNLVPWRSVAGNLALPLEIRNVSRSERDSRVQEAIEKVGLAGFGKHYPSELSGGMRKRVTLARALIYGANTLLMDEPFGALDAQLKLVIEDELMKLWEEARPTILYVTHDLTEAITLADRVVVFSARPAQVLAIEEIPIPRPRDLNNTRFLPQFKDIHERLWGLLKVNQGNFREK